MWPRSFIALCVTVAVGACDSGGQGPDALSRVVTALGNEASFTVCTRDSDCPIGTGKCVKLVSFSRSSALFPSTTSPVDLYRLFPTQLAGGQGVCTAECTQPNVTCEGGGTGSGWTCQVVATAGSAYAATSAESQVEYDAGDPFVALCRPPTQTNLCTACTSSAECGANRACIDPESGLSVAEGGAGVCTHGCSTDAQCSLGFACRTSGAQKLCVPSAGTCDDCADPDQDGYGVGRCRADQSASPVDCDQHDADTFYEVGRSPNPDRCQPNLDRNCNRVPDTQELVGPRSAFGTLHCKQCGDACETGSSCIPDPSTNGATGMCSDVCDRGEGDCDGDPRNGCETDLLQDLVHCGTCATSCVPVPDAVGEVTVAQLPPNVVPQCVQGACQRAACSAGFDDCDRNPSNGCEAFLLGDPANCGGCGQVCPAVPQLGRSAACVSETTCSSLWCPEGRTSCDGDAQNGCECSTAGCPTDKADCNGDGTCETSVGNVSSRCGAGECLAGKLDCDGSPVNGCESSAAAKESCGVCGNNCNVTVQHAIGTKCTATGCSYERCEADWGDCDGNRSNGCEAYLVSNENCGGCGAADASNVCGSYDHGRSDCTVTDVGPECATLCDSGWGSCGGNACDTPLNTWRQCGSCDVKCLPNTVCGASGCTNSCVSTATVRFKDCNGDLTRPQSNGCEVDVLSSDRNCGDCGRACAAGQQCVQGVCRS